jgi:phosphonate transport system substrate-binding protein
MPRSGDMLTVASYLAENARPVHTGIAEWVGRRLGEPVTLLDAPWEERLRRLDRGEVDLGFICGWPYSQRFDRPDRPIELCCAPVMAAPRYGGRPTYFTDVIVRADSPLQSFADLRGRSYAFNDPDSHSGYNVPRDHLLRLGETSGYFGRVVAGGSHQASIRLVEAGEVDSAGIDSTVLELEEARRPGLAGHLRIVESMGPSPIPPVVVSRNLPAPRRERIREALLAMHEDRDGQALLAEGLLARFVGVVDRDYDPIREVVRRATAAGFMVIR